MAIRELDIEQLKRILIASAGVDHFISLNGGMLDTDFEDLGYESVALLETSRRIEIEFGITLDDMKFTEARTPRALLQLVNETLLENGANHRA